MPWTDSAHAASPPITAEDLAYSRPSSDEAFLRRIYLDTVGVPPASSEVREFLANDNPNKRDALIDQFLKDYTGMKMMGLPTLQSTWLLHLQTQIQDL